MVSVTLVMPVKSLVILCQGEGAATRRLIPANAFVLVIPVSVVIVVIPVISIIQFIPRVATPVFPVILIKSCSHTSPQVFPVTPVIQVIPVILGIPIITVTPVTLVIIMFQLTTQPLRMWGGGFVKLYISLSTKILAMPLCFIPEGY